MSSKVRFIRSALKISPVSFGAYDLYNGQLIFSSGLAEKELGYSPKELKELSKNNFQAIIHPDDWNVSEESFDRLIKSQPGQMIEHILRAKKHDGDYLVFWIRDIIYEWDDENQPVKYASVVQDISELVRLEEELDSKVEALKEVAQKNAHDVRAPVANILGLVDLMNKESFKTDYHKRIFQHLEDTVKTLDKVILEINDISSET